MTTFSRFNPLSGLAGPPAVERSTAAALRAATRAEHRDADLAALVRSAALPGLRARIAAYRASVRGASGKPTQRS